MCYWGADKSLAQPTSRCILFDGENILFDASLVIYVNNINIRPIVVINRICDIPLMSKYASQHPSLQQPQSVFFL
jgi:hypothetical protein